MKKQKFYSQTVLFPTVLFGKPYFWMQDVDGTIYLAKATKNVTGYSVSIDGHRDPIFSDLVPDLT